MSKQEISPEEYNQLSPEEKAGYKEDWQERTLGGHWINVNEPDKAGKYKTRQIYRRLPVPEPVLEAPVKEETVETDAEMLRRIGIGETSIAATVYCNRFPNDTAQIRYWRLSAFMEGCKQSSNPNQISKDRAIEIIQLEMNSCPELTGICNYLISKIKEL